MYCDKLCGCALVFIRHKFKKCMFSLFLFYYKFAVYSLVYTIMFTISVGSMMTLCCFKLKIFYVWQKFCCYRDEAIVQMSDCGKTFFMKYMHDFGLLLFVV